MATATGFGCGSGYAVACAMEVVEARTFRACLADHHDDHHRSYPRRPRHRVFLLAAVHARRPRASFSASLTASLVACHSGAGVLGSIVVGILAGAVTLCAGQFAFAAVGRYSFALRSRCCLLRQRRSPGIMRRLPSRTLACRHKDGARRSQSLARSSSAARPGADDAPGGPARERYASAAGFGIAVADGGKHRGLSWPNSSWQLEWPSGSAVPEHDR
jgi:hypothetical protein